MSIVFKEESELLADNLNRSGYRDANVTEPINIKPSCLRANQTYHCATSPQFVVLVQYLHPSMVDLKCCSDLKKLS